VPDLAQSYFSELPFDAETQSCKGFKKIGSRLVRADVDDEAWESK